MMLHTRRRLFHLLGIPISADASWLVILALLTLSLANAFPAMLHDYFPAGGKEPPRGEYWVMGLITAVAFFTCIVLHEMGHALAARAQGIPIRGITLFLFGGVAELGDEPPSARSEFLMAIAGPVVTVVLTALLWLLAIVGYNGGWPHPVVIVLGYLAMINALVLVFNLVPAFPLDGGRVLRSIIWSASGSLPGATYWASLAGNVFAGLLIALGIVQFFVGNWLGGIWMALIGLFLHNAAQSGYQQVLMREMMRDDLNAITIAPDTDARDALTEMMRNDVSCLLVTKGGRIVGTICLRDLLRLLHVKLELEERDGPDQGPRVAPRPQVRHEVEVGGPKGQATS